MFGHARQPAQDRAHLCIQLVVTGVMFSIGRLLWPGLTGCLITASVTARRAFAVPLADPVRRYG